MTDITQCDGWITEWEFEVSVDVFFVRKSNHHKEMHSDHYDRENTNRGMKNNNRDIENIHKEM